MTVSNGRQCWMKRKSKCSCSPTFVVSQQSTERFVANDFFQAELIDRYQWRRVGQDGQHRTETIVREVKALLEQHAAKTASIQQLSARYQLSEKHFCRVFKRHTGLSPYQYYLHFRIHRAKEMLRDTALSIREIAKMLHFETSFHLSALFKKKTGMSPSQWRRGEGQRVLTSIKQPPAIGSSRIRKGGNSRSV
jgi:transcriptional regulator GlxA family with amidase domain